MRFVLPLLATAIAAHATAATTSTAAPTPITLDQAMANPDWIGNPVESAWWGWDSRQVYFKQKRNGSALRDTYQINGAAAKVVEEKQLANLDSADPVYNRERTRAILLRNGDLFERDLKTGALTQIVRGTTPAADAQYAADGNHVQFRVGSDWFSWSRSERLVSPVALLRTAKDPDAAPDADFRRDMQLRLISTLAQLKKDKDDTRDQRNADRAADATRAPQPIYLGDKVTIETSSLSPDGRYLLVVTAAKDGDKRRVGKLPKYVTESGYEETDDERKRVSDAGPLSHHLKLVEVATRKVTDLSLDDLPGIKDDPLAAMRAAQKLDALKGNRAVRFEGREDSIRWSANGARVAVMAQAIDNKDRWIASVDLSAAKLQPLHRLSDTAWVNNRGNDFGWQPDNSTLWYESEESGYGHLYLRTADGKSRALTSGKWEESNVTWSSDGQTAYFMCNPKLPGTYEVCSTSTRDGALKELTALGGVESFSLSPDGHKLLVRYSTAYMPAQIGTVSSSGGKVTQLTDTRSADYKAREWIEPQIVPVPSTHGADPVWAKLYRPATLEAGKKYPVVMFVHGAGYLQNVTKRYPVYFREQMFHNLLVQKGYIVLDMDYRASLGYGRNWRTAIYRQMGHPELEDYVDGLNWMVANQQGDVKNVGIYGGSYGGFMTFMALLRAPDQFKSGAALRPVTDWTTYNHEYTANILNTPELDPEAYKVSSPIEYADQLKGNLLIAHGMIDDNVFFQDSVRMAQRFIELKKDNWELAPYPLERHGFVHPESWYDEYRRIYQLFERTLK
ncbi:prolyl oligopeptidase family serine peptidase [Pseudoduganella sp. FT25W]|uniref:Prolyl oligopeptidase family serine peptidase n=1 Tax=Duganella alba TaxID=2666081 RepID=A0A6L5QLW7_9BURK|nr:S9 family peptidase [Duganella alba]MRX10803.1 prolyl oligopeptidase family serine peptidase [Duganella alba]MRX18922.1 prolyl oligopeptidase family serine peptidase [Duganella alba]